MVEIEKTSKRYMKQQLMLAVAVALIALLVMRLSYINAILVAVVVGFAFTLIVSCVIAMVWRKVASHNPEGLPTFFTAASGGRLLLALATMFVFYLASGREDMLVFFLVFMAFYLVSLAHHAAFFAKVSGKS